MSLLVSVLFSFALPLSVPPASATPPALQTLVSLPPHLFFFHTSQDALCRYADLLSSAIRVQISQGWKTPRHRLALRQNAAFLYRLNKAFGGFLQTIEDKAQTPDQKRLATAIQRYLSEASPLLETAQKVALSNDPPVPLERKPWQTWAARCPTLPVPPSQAWSEPLTRAWMDFFEILALSHEQLLYIRVRQIRQDLRPKPSLRLSLLAQSHLDALRAWKLRQPKATEVGLLLYHVALLARASGFAHKQALARAACSGKTPCPDETSHDTSSLKFLQQAESSLRSNDPKFTTHWRFLSP